VRAWIPTTYFGDVWLLERGYSGVTQVLGSASLGSGGNYTARQGLDPGAAGKVIKNQSSRSGTVIASRTISKELGDVVGTVFYGPDTTLAAGSYEMNVVVSGTKIGSNSSGTGSTPVVAVNFTGESADLYPVNFTDSLVNLSWFGSGAWTSLDFNFTLSCPILNAVIAGETLVSWFGFQVNYVSITPEKGT
jgi:hypothetical protein